MLIHKQNKKDKLKYWIRTQKTYGTKYIKTSDIFLWGINNYNTSAPRYAREFAADGELIKRISNSEAVLLGFTGNEGVYEII